MTTTKRSMIMKEQFKVWLEQVKGCRKFAASGNRGTAIDYAYRVAKVCEVEGMTFEQLAGNIDVVLPSYESAGEKSGIGKKSHSSVVCALRKFSIFAREQTSEPIQLTHEDKAETRRGWFSKKSK
jgi:hypothetical protein